MKLVGLIITTVFLGATVAEAAEVKLQSLQVQSKLKAGKPYRVKVKYSATGEVDLSKACFLWSGEGPFCFSGFSDEKGVISLKLRTNNPGRYKLEGYIQYVGGGQFKNSNKVAKTIRVRR
ncbi:MAG: hypothetical protein AAGF81_01360 [Pseudomonadota bacterium]